MKPPTDIIREACIKANPEIVELKFGCKTSKGIITTVFESEGHYGYAMTPDSTNWQGGNGEATARTYTKERFEIIGRPIRLADVLLAIQERVEEVDVENFQCESPRELWVKWSRKIVDLWDFENDNIDHQSEETKKFIAGLLT